MSRSPRRVGGVRGGGSGRTRVRYRSLVPSHSCRAESSQAAHRPQPRLQTPMISFDGVVRVLLHNMTRGRQQLIDHPRIDRCPISGHLARIGAVFEGVGEKPASGRQIPLARDQHIDDLAELVDRPTQIPLSPSNPHIRLSHKPAIAGGVPAGSGRVDQQRGEPLHPAVDRDMINADTTSGQQFLDVAVGQVVAQVLPHRHHDHIRREREPGEAGHRRARWSRTRTYQLSLPQCAIRRCNRPLEAVAHPNVVP